MSGGAAIAQVVRNSATVAVVPQYWQLRKFNIRELCMSDEERAAQEAENAAVRAQQAAKAAAKAAATTAAVETQRGDAADAAPDVTEPPESETQQPAADDAAQENGVTDVTAGSIAPPEAVAAESAAGAPPDDGVKANDSGVPLQDTAS